MEILNVSSLANAMRRCRDSPNYRVVIVMSSQLRIREFISEMKTSLCYERDDVTSISRAGIIRFENGSVIHPISINSRTRGLSAHEVIYDDSIDRYEILRGVKRLVLNYLSERTQKHHEEERECATLDSFLSEFKIL